MNLLTGLEEFALKDDGPNRWVTIDRSHELSVDHNVGVASNRRREMRVVAKGEAVVGSVLPVSLP